MQLRRSRRRWRCKSLPRSRQAEVHPGSAFDRRALSGDAQCIGQAKYVLQFRVSAQEEAIARKREPSASRGGRGSAQPEWKWTQSQVDFRRFLVDDFVLELRGHGCLRRAPSQYDGNVAETDLVFSAVQRQPQIRGRACSTHGRWSRAGTLREKYSVQLSGSDQVRGQAFLCQTHQAQNGRERHSINRQLQVVTGRGRDRTHIPLQAHYSDANRRVAGKIFQPPIDAAVTARAIGDQADNLAFPDVVAVKVGDRQLGPNQERLRSSGDIRSQVHAPAPSAVSSR